MTTPDNDPIFQALASGKGRSPVYRWLRARHGQISAALQKVGSRPNWQALADMAWAEGVKDGRGQPPSGDVMRDQWREVCKDVVAAAPSQATPRGPMLPVWPQSAGSDGLVAALNRRKTRGGEPL